MIKFAILILIICPLIKEASAEYRVYQYYVRSKIQNINPSKAELVTSTLNPRTYAAYHGGTSSVDLTLLRSWMCMGNTSHTDVCTISEGKELSEAMPVAQAKAVAGEVK